MARPFLYRGASLCTQDIPLERLARRYGTPLYVYDFDAVAAAVAEFKRAFAWTPHQICAAVKANGNLALLQRLAAWGCGFDVVSGGELERVLRAGGRAETVVFSGVGKTAGELDLALKAGILLFQVESEPELELLAQRAARLRRRARFGLRVNPDVDAATHPHIATGMREHKFGLEMAVARRLFQAFRPGGSKRAATRWLEPAGIGFHIGSQLLSVAPFAEAVARVGGLAGELTAAGMPLRYWDVGGGLGIAYRAVQRPPSLAAYARALRPALKAAARSGTPPMLLLEPGRRLVATAGCLLTRVLYIKRHAGRTFVITDAGSNDLIRPSLYGAYHEIQPLEHRPGRGRQVEVVGPICESSDTFAKARMLPPVEAGDGLALLDTGAYGFALSSNYNARPRAAEVAIEGGKARLIRAREPVADLWRGERGGR